MLREAILTSTLLFFSATSEATIEFKPNVGITGTDNQIFPSHILSMAGNQPMDASELNDGGDGKVQYVLESPDGLIGAAIAGDEDADIELEVLAGQFAQPSKWSGHISKGVIYQISPLVEWDYERLNKLSQPVPLTITFNLYVNGTKRTSKKVIAKLRSINDVPFGAMANGEFINNSHLFAAFVNENHPWIDSILKEAIDTGLVNSFSGYQANDPRDVSQQVFSIWNILQKRGFKYSSITTSSGHSTNIYSQSVRFLDQSITASQANCVDGTVLFASILKKINIEPILVMVPGHMFLGFYMDQEKTQPVFLETTMLGNSNLKQYETDSSLLGALSSSLGGATQNSVSAKSYMSAMKVASDRARKEWDKLIHGEPGYMYLVIQDAREMGISPINYAGTN